MLSRIPLFGLALLAGVSFSTAGQASSVPLAGFPGLITTGQQQFTIDPVTSERFSTDPHKLGGQTVVIDDIANLGPAIAALLSFTGDTFKVRYEVEGVGALTFSDKVTVEVSALLNNQLLGSKESFDVQLNGSCGSTTDFGIIQDCRAVEFLTAFDSSQPIVIPANTPPSSLTFVYDVIQSDESCVAKILQDEQIVSGACIQGGTTVLDTTDAFDPRWSADIRRVPEPSGLAVFGVALAGLGLVRRRRAA